MRLRHLGIDFQRVLITRYRFGLVVFFGQQIAPRNECFRIPWIGFRDEFQKVVSVMKFFGGPQSTSNPKQIVRGSSHSVFEIVDELLIYGLSFFALAGVVENAGLF